MPVAPAPLRRSPTLGHPSGDGNTDSPRSDDAPAGNGYFGRHVISRNPSVLDDQGLLRFKSDSTRGTDEHNDGPRSGVSLYGATGRVASTLSEASLQKQQASGSSTSTTGLGRRRSGSSPDDNADGPLSSRGSVASLGGGLQTSSRGGGASCEDLLEHHQAAAPFTVAFVQDHHESVVIDLPGRPNPLLLLHQGQFSIRLTSHIDTIAIAKLEIDGTCTRCNFRLLPHQTHTIRETRISVGQHAVPLTFDPAENQLRLVRSADDVDAAVGTLRILFFAAREAPATLKWDWDPRSPMDVVAFDYGYLASFATDAFPMVKQMYREWGGEPPGLGGSRTGGQRPPVVPHSAVGVKAVPAAPRLQPAQQINRQRMANAYEKHVLRSQTKNQPPSHQLHQHHPPQPNAESSRVRSVSPPIAHPSRSEVSSISSSMANPLLQLDMSKFRSATHGGDSGPPSLNTTKQRSDSGASQPRPAETSHDDGITPCATCFPIVQRLLRDNAAREEDLLRQLDEATVRINNLESELAVSRQPPAARSASPPVVTTSGASHWSRSVPKSSRSSQLRQDRFAIEEVTIDDAALRGRWDMQPSLAPHVDPTVGDPGDRILAFAQQVIANEKKKHQVLPTSSATGKQPVNPYGRTSAW